MVANGQITTAGPDCHSAVKKGTSVRGLAVTPCVFHSIFIADGEGDVAGGRGVCVHRGR